MVLKALNMVKPHTQVTHICTHNHRNLYVHLKRKNIKHKTQTNYHRFKSKLTKHYHRHGKYFETFSNKLYIYTYT